MTADHVIHFARDQPPDGRSLSTGQALCNAGSLYLPRDGPTGRYTRTVTKDWEAVTCQHCRRMQAAVSRKAAGS